MFRIDRHTVFKKDGSTRTETAFGVTSLSPEQASPDRILSLVRGHWEIENRLHWVKDTAYREDASAIRSGHGPQIMTALRNMAISFLRLGGATSIAPVLDLFGNKPSRVLRFLGL